MKRVSQKNSTISHLAIIASLFLFYVLTTSLIILAFNDDTPIWKIFATSTISTYATCHFMFSKKNKGYVYNKYQSREYEFGAFKIESSKIVEKLKKEGFKNVLDNKTSISFKSKTDMFNISLLKDNLIMIKSKPRIWIKFFDQGELYEQLNVIEEKVFSNLSEDEIVNKT